MPQQVPPDAQAMGLIVPLVVIALVILRNSRARRLRIETLWIAPVMIVAMIGLSLSQEGQPSPLALAVDLAGMAVGALIGWWRARFTRIDIDPETHQLTSRASPIGMLIILGVFVIRYALRMYVAEGAAPAGVPVHVLADAILVMSVGLVCAQRLEIALRANRLLAEHRTSSAV
ncbi:MAG: hypothetical protein ACXWKX_20445 [Caulobacteraceae bacterium]